MSRLSAGLQAATVAALMGSFAFTGTATATADPSQNSAADVNTLSASLSKGYGLNNCQPSAPDQTNGLALAQLECGQNPLPGGPASATYLLFGHADALAAAFKYFTKDLSPAPCGEGGKSQTAWQVGQATGQEACGTYKDAATIVWTTDGKNVVGIIRSSNADVNSLRQWWLTNG